MKLIKTFPYIVRLPLFVAGLGLVATGLYAQDTYREIGATPPPAADAKAAKNARYSNQPNKGTTTARISFTDKSKAGKLNINLPTSEINIEGTNGDEVIVTSTLEQEGAGKVDDDGFRRLDQEVAFELTEKDNVATLRIAGNNPWVASGAEFKIQVPRNTSLTIKTHSGDGIKVDNVDGDIEIATVNGEISLGNVGGSVIANTMGGTIDAEFKNAPKKPISLTAMNGDIKLVVPSATAANLRMRSLNGTIRTNFPEAALKTTTTTTPAIETKKVEMQITTTGTKGMTIVTSTDGSSYSYSTTIDGMPAAPIPPVPPVPAADSDLVEAIVEARKVQAAGYADMGLAAAQKGIAAAVQAIDSIKGLSGEEKELLKRKIQAGGNVIPRSMRVSIPSIGGKTISGELNGGGVDIQLTTMNGGITLKKGD